jgi:RNA polymerase II subunit A small phosphatase-like protein
MESFAAPRPVPSDSRCCSRAAIDDSPRENAQAATPEDLIPPPSPEDAGKICLVLDLDETLIHSSFAEMSDADLSFSFGDDEDAHNVYVRVRPGAKEFIAELAPFYELVVFTASAKTYADQVVNFIDPDGLIRYRLYRDSCTGIGGSLVKDLSRLNRKLEKVIILDNSPAAYLLHPYNAVPIPSWFDDPNDNVLGHLMYFFRHSYKVRNVYGLLGSE